MNVRCAAAVTAAAIVAVLAGAAPAPAASSGEPLGAHVSQCAQASLKERPDPPAVTCAHDGHVQSFATFGELVAHLREHHG
jgi:hypothetical protein